MFNALACGPEAFTGRSKMPADDLSKLHSGPPARIALSCAGAVKPP